MKYPQINPNKPGVVEYPYSLSGIKRLHETCTHHPPPCEQLPDDGCKSCWPPRRPQWSQRDLSK